jgi:hypothetical protein
VEACAARGQEIADRPPDARGACGHENAQIFCKVEDVGGIFLFERSD